MGFGLSLDDFGTGQSSLAYIQRLNPDAIKVDRSFIENIHLNHSNEALVAAVTELSARLGLRVIAEGVEVQDQLSVLKKLGCAEIQGYLLSAPMPEAAFTEWLGMFAKNRADAEKHEQKQERQSA